MWEPAGQRGAQGGRGTEARVCTRVCVQGRSCSSCPGGREQTEGWTGSQGHWDALVVCVWTGARPHLRVLESSLGCREERRAGRGLLAEPGCVWCEALGAWTGAGGDDGERGTEPAPTCPHPRLQGWLRSSPALRGAEPLPGLARLALGACPSPQTLVSVPCGAHGSLAWRAGIGSARGSPPGS